MNGKEIYKIWAPESAKWTEWVRPVPFIRIKEDFKNTRINEFEISDINYFNGIQNNVAIIVDLPGYDSIKEGISLVKDGFRPIPVYNGTFEQKDSVATTDNAIIEEALVFGAVELKKLQISENALPAFLIDTNRMNRYKMSVSVFDNSWDLYHQDLPSAEYFLKNKIDKIIIRSNIKIQEDLNKIFYKFQSKGIQIYFTNGFEEPKKVLLKKPKEKEE